MHHTELVLCVGSGRFESCLKGAPPWIGLVAGNQLRFGSAQSAPSPYSSPLVTHCGVAEGIGLWIATLFRAPFHGRVMIAGFAKRKNDQYHLNHLSRF